MLCNIAGSQLEERKGGCRSTAHHSTWHAYVAYCLRISCRIFRVYRLQFFPRVVSKFSKWKRMKFSRGKLLDGRDMLFRKRYPFSRARFLERVRDGIFQIDENIIIWSEEQATKSPVSFCLTTQFHAIHYYRLSPRSRTDTHIARVSAFCEFKILSILLPHPKDKRYSFKME